MPSFDIFQEIHVLFDRCQSGLRCSIEGSKHLGMKGTGDAEVRFVGDARDVQDRASAVRVCRGEGVFDSPVPWARGGRRVGNGKIEKPYDRVVATRKELSLTEVGESVIDIGAVLHCVPVRVGTRASAH